MPLLRYILPCLTILILSAGVEASPPLPAERDDSVRRIRDDLEVIARNYSYPSNPTETQLTAWCSQLGLLQSRCIRLGVKGTTEGKTLLGMITECERIIAERVRLDREQRESEVKPYVFGPISGPTLREGGHSEEGIKCLTSKVDEFLTHYRALKRKRQAYTDVHLAPSRSYFRRTIQVSMDTAQRQLKFYKAKNEVTDILNGGFASDHYSPRENLFWALAVARIAEDFELKVGGSAEPWRDLQTKILEQAANSEIDLY